MDDFFGYFSICFLQENLLKAICTYVDNHSQENESFAVICEGTTLAQRSPMKVKYFKRSKNSLSVGDGCNKLNVNVYKNTVFFAVIYEGMSLVYNSPMKVKYLTDCRIAH